MCVCVYVCMYVFIYLSIYLSIYLFMYLFIYSCIHSFIYVYNYMCIYIYIHCVSSESRLKSSQALLSEWLIAGVCAQFEASWGLDLLGRAGKGSGFPRPGSHPGCFRPNRWETMDLTIQRWRFMRWIDEPKKSITWADGMEWHGKNGHVKMPFGLTNSMVEVGIATRLIGSSNPHEANKAWQHNTI